MTHPSQPPEPPPSGEEPEPVPSQQEIAAELDAVDAELEAAEAAEAAEASEASEASEPAGAAEPTADAEAVDADDERRYPSTIGGAFYLLVLIFAAIGIGIAWAGDWRLGIRCLAGGLCFAALLRLVLPARDAGMLAVRHRLFDCVLLGAVGLALFFLAATIPDQPG